MKYRLLALVLFTIILTVYYFFICPTFHLTHNLEHFLGSIILFTLAIGMYIVGRLLDMNRNQ